LVNFARTVRYYGAGANLTQRELRLLQIVEPVVRAEEILVAKHYEGILGAETMYTLIMTATDNKELALRTKTQMQLNNL